ncbi:MAG: DUF4855 domain-containing protein [bacterium]
MAFFAQNKPDFNYLRHLILLYGNAQTPWTSEDLKYYVAHLDPEGRVDDWLYDSFLFLNVKSGSGRDYCADVNMGTTMSGEGDFFAACSPQPAVKADWEELLEFYFGEHGALQTLDQTIDHCCSKEALSLGHTRNVVLMLPYPHISQREFGAVNGSDSITDFSTVRQNLEQATQKRLLAEQWFVDEIVKRYSSLKTRHLNLLGVYWMFETVYRSWDIDDHWLLKELRKHIHSRGLKFLWIPFWSTYNIHLLDDYQQYYFDLAFLQPNYMFYRSGKTLENAVLAVRSREAGIEMEYYLELNEPIAIQNERQARFRNYLNGGVQLGYMNEAACAHFQGASALQRMHHHQDPLEREFYEDIYQFIKGTYKVKS